MFIMVSSHERLRYNCSFLVKSIVNSSMGSMAFLEGTSTLTISSLASLVVWVPLPKKVTPQFGTSLLKMTFQLSLLGMVQREYVPADSGLSIIFTASLAVKVVGSFAPVLQTWLNGTRSP